MSVGGSPIASSTRRVQFVFCYTILLIDPDWIRSPLRSSANHNPRMDGDRTDIAASMVDMGKSEVFVDSSTLPVAHEETVVAIHSLSRYRNFLFMPALSAWGP